MKSPDDIKKGLKEHAEDCCSACPYWDDCNVEDAMVQLAADALALIQQLEFQNGELLKTVEMLKAEIEEYEEAAEKCCYESRCNAELNQLEALCKRLRDENKQLEAERDAMMEYVHGRCPMCKHYARSIKEEPCASCYSASGHNDNWEWRGVQKEE